MKKMDNKPIKHMILTILALILMIISLIWVSQLPTGAVSTEIRRLGLIMIWGFVYVGLLALIYRS